MFPRMRGDVAGRQNEVPERFVPEAMRGELVEAEHLSRYWWAAGLVAGRRVLDAGCGTGYGAAILASAGADDVLGIDIAEAVVEVAGALQRPGLSFESGDLRDLARLPDGAFDVVTCFEVIEHVDDPTAIVTELARVLAPGGVLAVSSPNRERYVPGNPHHRRELLPDELRALLEEVLPEVRLLAQHDWIGSAVLDVDVAAAETTDPLADLLVRKVVARPPGSETYTLALAGTGPLPAPPASTVLTDTVELRRWLGHYEAQQAMLAAQRDHLGHLESRLAERQELQLRLVESETELVAAQAREAESAERIGRQAAELEAARAAGEAVADVLRQERDALAAEAERWRSAAYQAYDSRSWRLTAALRRLRALTRRRPRR
jgi:SAM-dependent methyltransferase